MKRIELNRKNIDVELRGVDKRKYFSPANYGDFKVTLPFLKQYCKGRCLDAGCGDMPYNEYLIKLVEHYDTLDYKAHVPGIKYVGDVQNMDMIHDNIYDTIVCFEVLEHVTNPFKAVSEIRRIIKENGIFILTVPHLSRLHDIPNDYFRYTKYGIKSLLENNRFKVLEIKPRGGLFSFLGHQFSNIFQNI
ncbi:MAG: methyltransferase domain-containing protein [Bacteroidetes bacterium]|nr:methyltransferase domain-containing protein [Bacteroidota bacterium]